MIPKIIHYCWLSNDEVPTELQQCMNTWKDLLKDYEFKKWDFSVFDKSSSVWVQEAFDNKKYAFACDYIRLFALYNYGGIYLDMDIEILKNLDTFLSNEYMMAKERPDQVWIEAGCMGAEKKAPFILDCLKYYQDKHFINEQGIYEDTPLPRIMAKVYKEGNYNFYLGDWQTFTCKSYDTGVITTNENSYAIHHFAGSWKDKREQEVHLKALKFRKVFLIGVPLSFVYEKGYKTITSFKQGGLKDVLHKVQRFVRRSN